MRRTFVSRQFDSRWIPARSRVAPALQKLMIVLHGRGDSYRAFADIRREIQIPEMNYLLLNAPDVYEEGYSWYETGLRHAPGVGRARRKLFALVADLRNAGWKQEDIYWLGHSQGALMVCDLLMNHPGAFGGAVGISGYVWFFKGWKTKARSSAAWSTPWLMTYGQRDRVIPPEEIREDLEILWSAGAPVVARGFAKGHDFDFNREIPFVREWLRFQISGRRGRAALRASFHAPLSGVSRTTAQVQGLPFVLRERRRSARPRV